MPDYFYQALDQDNQLHKGQLQAENEQDLVNQLARQDLLVIETKPVQRSLLQKRDPAQAKSEEIGLLLKELSTLLKAGVNLMDALSSLKEGQHSPALLASLEKILSELRNGQKFSNALEKSGLRLPAYLHQLLRAGELTGELGENLHRAVEQMEYEAQLATETRNALIYPSVLMFSGIGAVLLVFTFVVPNFQNLLNQADRLPWLAWAVLSTGKWFNEHLIQVALGSVVSLLLVARLIRQAAVRAKLLNFAARLPLIGAWLEQGDLARWASVLAALLASKVPLLAALELARQGVRLPARQQRLERVEKGVKSGQSLSAALQEARVITPTGFNLIRAGEKSGELPALVQALAKLYNESGRNRTQRLLSLIEPLAILIIGSVIGLIIMGVILAITSANDLAL